jgi:hypothetical protein
LLQRLGSLQRLIAPTPAGGHTPSMGVYIGA